MPSYGTRFAVSSGGSFDGSEDGWVEGAEDVSPDTSGIVIVGSADGSSVDGLADGSSDGEGEAKADGEGEAGGVAVSVTICVGFTDAPLPSAYFMSIPQPTRPANTIKIINIGNSRLLKENIYTPEYYKMMGL